jgi:hypothetical protein
MSKRRIRERVAGAALEVRSTQKPFFVDDRHSRRADGPAVVLFYPQFSRRVE